MKPWHRRRPGETEADLAHRLAHSCYRCGHQMGDLRELDRHEDGCTATTNVDSTVRDPAETR